MWVRICPSRARKKTTEGEKKHGMGKGRHRGLPLQLHERNNQGEKRIYFIFYFTN
jgi:hypothetical protein